MYEAHTQRYPFAEQIILSILMIYVFGVIIVAMTGQWFYAHYYKKKFVRSFLQEELGFAIYEPRKHLSAVTLYESKLFPSFNWTEGSDWFRCEVEQAILTASNVTLSQRINTKNGQTVNKVFQGCVLSLTFSDPFETPILIKGKRWMSWSKQLLLGESLERVKLIAPDFMKRFDVWSSDQIASRKLLTPAFTEKMTELDKQYPFTISITSFKVTIALEGELDFSPRFFLLPPRSDEARVKRLKKALDMVRAVVQTLNLKPKKEIL